MQILTLSRSMHELAIGLQQIDAKVRQIDSSSHAPSDIQLPSTLAMLRQRNCNSPDQFSKLKSLCLDVPHFSGEIEKAAGIQGASAFLLYYQRLRPTSFLTNSRINHPSPLRNYFQRKWRLKEKQIHAINVMPNTSLGIIIRGLRMKISEIISRILEK